MPPEIKTATEVGQDLGSGMGKRNECNNEFSKRRAKRKNGNVWYEEGGRYLWKNGPNGSAAFDTWVWFGEPLLRKRA
jgi:hypothetical protein